MSEEEVLTISDFEVLPIKLQLTILYEELVCRIDPMLEEILDEIRGGEEMDQHFEPSPEKVDVMGPWKVDGGR